MAGYGDQINGPYSYAGGSSILPEYWANDLAKAVNVYSVWSRLATPVVIDTPILQRGAGYKVHWSHTTNLSVTAAGTLVSGTAIAVSSNTLVNGDATIVEFGNAMGLEGFPIWLSDPAYQPFGDVAQGKQGKDAIRSLVDWGVKSWDRYVGGRFLDTTTYIHVNSGSTYTYGDLPGGGTASGGTVVLTLDVLSQIRGEMGRYGLAPRADLGGLYGIVAPAGGHRWLSNTDGVQRDAASLGIDEAFRRGFVGAFGGFAFIEEWGANPVTTFSTTTGTGCIICEDAVVADADMGAGPDYLVWYNDVGNDSGRQKKMNLYFRGIADLMLPATVGSSMARSIMLCYKM
jgi:hypothetical protein